MRLVSYMLEHGLNDAELAARIGVSGELVRLWRHGKRKISPKRAIDLSKATGIPRHEIRPDIWEPPPTVKKVAPTPEPIPSPRAPRRRRQQAAE